jgi:hypothetical protein
VKEFKNMEEWLGGRRRGVGEGRKEEEDEKGSRREHVDVGGSGGSNREQEWRSRRDEEGSR